MNAFLAGLYSGWSTVQKRATPVQAPIDPTNYFGATSVDGEWELRNNGNKVDYPAARDILASDTVAHAVELMMRCKDAFRDHAIKLLMLTYQACHQYSVHQFPSAHLIAWSVIEMQLSMMWAALLKEVDIEHGGHTKMNRDRRGALKGGRDYTASVVTQILSLLGRIDDALLSQLDEARKKRNAFAHSLEPIGASDAGKAIRTATDLMSKVTGFRITSQLSLSFWL